MSNHTAPAGSHPDLIIDMIERVRARRGVPSSHLSHAMGRPDGAWWQIIRTGSSPKIDDVRKAANAIGLTIEIRDTMGRKVI